MQTIEMVVDGKRIPITENEARVALNAVKDYRKSLKKLLRPRKIPIREERDRECWQLHMLGYTDAEIGREIGITARSVRGALCRVENGRYA